MLITGMKGTGKRAWLVYLIWRLAKAGLPVAIRCNGMYHLVDGCTCVSWPLHVPMCKLSAHDELHVYHICKVPNQVHSKVALMHACNGMLTVIAI